MFKKFKLVHNMRNFKEKLKAKNVCVGGVVLYTNTFSEIFTQLTQQDYKYTQLAQ